MRIAVGCCLLLLAAVAAFGADEQIKKIDFTGLTALIDSGMPMLLIDNRAKDPYINGHITTAVNIPGYLFDNQEVPGLPVDRDTPIVAYCNGGHCGISWYVAERLLDLGFTRVLVYDEGTAGWLKQGQKLVTERHEKLPQISLDELKALLAAGSNVRLVDVREAPLFGVGSLPNAANVPLDSCKPGAPGMPPSLDDLVVVFGQGRWDARALHVADRLRAWGYKKVRVFSGGYNLWRKQ